MTTMLNYTIPKISQRTYDLAHECAIQLWHGVEFSDGKNQTSDARLLNTWAGKFQKSLQRNQRVRYTNEEFTELMSAAKIRLFKRMDSAQRRDINASFNYGLKDLYKQSNVGGDVFNQTLGLGIGKRKGVGARIIIASRMIFFALPDRCTFNLTRELAACLGMPSGPHKFNSLLTNALHDRMILDWNILRKYQMPLRTNELTEEVWRLACDNGWWQRRILDIALLIDYGLATAQYTRSMMAKQNPKKC